jgi:hypothetical protein
MNKKEDFSDELLSLYNNFNKNYSTKPLIQRLETDLGNVNINENFDFNPLYGTGEILTGQQKMIGLVGLENNDLINIINIQSKNKIYREGEYTINYFSKGYQIYPHFNLSSYSITENSFKNILNCSNKFYSYYFSSISSEKTSHKYIKIVNIYSLIFGLSEGKIYCIGNYVDNDKLIDSYTINGTINEGENILFSNYVKNIFLLKNSSDYFLLTQLQNLSILFFEINVIERKDLNDILYYDSSLNLIYYSSSLTEIINIYHVKFLNDDNLIISSENNGMQIFNKNLSYLRNIDSDFGNYTSFDFIDDTLYSVKNNYGLIIYNLTNYSIIQSYYHKSMSQLDIFINPFNGKKFLGVTFENSEIKEFFIEFYLNSKTDLIINKVFTKKKVDKSAITSFITIDDFFSFFLDSSTTNIHIIRRGILNIYKVSSYTFKFVNANYPLLVPYYNGTNNKIYPAILANEIIYKGENFIFFNQSIKCYFKEKGDFIMLFLHETENCQNSINQLINNVEDTIPICYQTIYYKIRVLETFNKIKYILPIILLSILIVICIILLIIWCYFGLSKNYQTLLNES